MDMLLHDEDICSFYQVKCRRNILIPCMHGSLCSYINAIRMHRSNRVFLLQLSKNRGACFSGKTCNITPRQPAKCNHGQRKVSHDKSWFTQLFTYGSGIRLPHLGRCRTTINSDRCSKNRIFIEVWRTKDQVTILIDTQFFVINRRLSSFADGRTWNLIRVKWWENHPPRLLNVNMCVHNFQYYFLSDGWAFCSVLQQMREEL